MTTAQIKAKVASAVVEIDPTVLALRFCEIACQMKRPEGMATWLAKLRDEGPSYAMGNDWFVNDTLSDMKLTASGHQFRSVIIPAGLAALEEWERQR